MWDNGDTNPLYLVGDSASTDQLLYQYNRDGYQGCRADQLALVDTSHSRFILRGDYRLHLHANIGMSLYSSQVIKILQSDWLTVMQSFPNSACL